MKVEGPRPEANASRSEAEKIGETPASSALSGLTIHSICMCAYFVRIFVTFSSVFDYISSYAHRSHKISRKSTGEGHPDTVVAVRA